MNVPTEELASFERICFQIEQAYWFYDDFYRERDPRLPRLHLREFALAGMMRAKQPGGRDDAGDYLRAC